MEKENLTKIYENIKEQKFYTGGPNFLNGNRVCPSCKSDMHRMPLNQSFVRVPGGKILVNINSNSGEMMLSQAEPRWGWDCTNCVLGISKGQ